MMEGHKSSENTYVLGNHPEELARLDRQAAALDRPTRLLLQAARITPGSRVLDLGTGLGHVAQIVAELVGPSGSVLGIDRSADVLAVARARAREVGAGHLTYEEGDARVWRASEPLDAIVGRLLLFHVPDPAAVVAHHLQNLRPGGEFVAIDFDLGGSRAEPAVPIVDDALRWVQEAFRAVGAWPRIGAKLGPILETGGLSRVSSFGIQAYLPSRDPSGAALLAGIVRSLAEAIVGHGIATAEQLDVATLEQRIAEAVRQADAVILLPTVVGAWGYAPAES
jgi:SAM-dependent methyltransferase